MMSDEGSTDRQDLGTDRSDSVREFQFFVILAWSEVKKLLLFPVRSSPKIPIFCGQGPSRSEFSIFPNFPQDRPVSVHGSLNSWRPMASLCRHKIRRKTGHYAHLIPSSANFEKVPGHFLLNLIAICFLYQIFQLLGLYQNCYLAHLNRVKNIRRSHHSLFHFLDGYSILIHRWI